MKTYILVDRYENTYFGVFSSLNEAYSHLGSGDQIIEEDVDEFVFDHKVVAEGI